MVSMIGIGKTIIIIGIIGLVAAIVGISWPGSGTAEKAGLGVVAAVCIMLLVSGGLLLGEGQAANFIPEGVFTVLGRPAAESRDEKGKLLPYEELAFTVLLAPKGEERRKGSHLLQRFVRKQIGDNFDRMLENAQEGDTLEIKNGIVHYTPKQ